MIYNGIDYDWVRLGYCEGLNEEIIPKVCRYWDAVAIYLVDITSQGPLSAKKYANVELVIFPVIRLIVSGIPQDTEFSVIDLIEELQKFLLENEYIDLMYMAHIDYEAEISAIFCDMKIKEYESENK